MPLYSTLTLSIRLYISSHFFIRQSLLPFKTPSSPTLPIGTQHTPFGTCVLCYFCCCCTTRRRRRSTPPARSLWASQVAKVQSGWHHQQLLHDDVQIDSRVGCSMKLLPFLEQVKSTCPSALQGLHSLVWSGHFRGGTSVTVRSSKIPAAVPHQTLCTITFGATLDPSYCCLRPRFALCTRLCWGAVSSFDQLRSSTIRRLIRNTP